MKATNSKNEKKTLTARLFKSKRTEIIKAIMNLPPKGDESKDNTESNLESSRI